MIKIFSRPFNLGDLSSGAWSQNTANSGVSEFFTRGNNCGKIDSWKTTPRKSVFLDIFTVHRSKTPVDGFYYKRNTSSSMLLDNVLPIICYILAPIPSRKMPDLRLRNNVSTRAVEATNSVN